MRYFLVGIALLVSVFVFASLMALNVKTSYTTLVRIETQEQYEYVISGLDPNIDFVSFRDTPYNDKVKILKVKYHTTTEYLFNESGQVVADWLGNAGMRSYPELVR